jgi:hypothetical protein
MKARIPLIAAVAVALCPLEASAQAWLSNPDFSEGIGIRVGNLELHPSVGAEFGYDSNFFRASEREGVIDVLKLRVTPSLSLSTLGSARSGGAGQRDISFTADAYASYYELFPLDSSEDAVRARRNVGIGVNARLVAFEHRKVGFDALAGYVRTIDTEGRSDDLAGEGFNRDTARGGAGVTWRPGGGQFEWRLGYLLTYHWFESSIYDPLTNVHHDISTRGRWRFLPRSALLFDSGYTLIRYTHNDTQQTDGDAIRARVGFHGLVTYHLSLLGILGWAASFYQPRAGAIEPRQYDSLIANAEARWFIQPQPDLDSASITTGLSSLALGYARTFNNSYYGSFYQRDRGYVQFNAFLLGALAGGLEFGVSRVAYPDVVTPTYQKASFAQLRLDARAFAEYRFTETLAANATIMYDQVNSDQVNNEDLDYRRWQAYIGVRWFM